MKISNLKKTYNSNTDNPIEALKGISFDLPDSGMVFVLGKSGSGKSTLLNILSGLDRADEGTVNICGNNLQELNSNELANYRNSCCGFIFQEYNLIPELTVKENIMLSLELQGQKQVDKEVSRVLELVELGGYENRKVTALSGGQRQRVAIARALIKNPQIIFADEPTGALDETTGESILNILKQLSKDMLVVIVSHDKDFVNRYADRIIELLDGQIANDTVQGFHSNETEPVKLHKSSLPIKSALKVGCGNFKYHPIRFIITVILSVLSFTFLGGCINIAMYNPDNSFITAMYNSGASYTAIYKYNQFVPEGNDFSLDNFLRGSNLVEEDSMFTKEDIESIKNNFKGYLAVVNYAPTYSYQISVVATIKERNDAQKISDDHIGGNVDGYISIGYAECESLGFTITGRLPENSDEIAINECMVNQFMVAGIIEAGVTYPIKEMSDIIGHKIPINLKNEADNYKTITGVVDTHCNRECGISHEKVQYHENEHFHEKIFVSLDYFPEYTYVLCNIDSDYNSFKNSAKFILNYNENNQIFKFNNEFNYTYYSFVYTSEVLRGLFFYLSLIFFVFTMILLINFIAVSIRSQMKQIGILSSMGADYKQICKIYCGSSLVLSGIVFLISTPLIIALTEIINKFFGDIIEASYKLLRLSPATIFITLAIIVISTLLGCLIPLGRMKKYSPIDIITKGQIK